MTTYNVENISRMFEVDCETVRRWIRAGALCGTKTSRKEGFAITEEDLFKFCDARPKYAEKFAKYKRRKAMISKAVMNVNRIMQEHPELVVECMMNIYLQHKIKEDLAQ